MSEKTTTVNWLDNLRVIATISVIILHVSASLPFQFTTLPHSHWWIGNTTNSFVRFCVPVFLMLTGALLLAKPVNSISHFLKKRFSRILLPFILWSLIYTTYNLLLKLYHGDIGVSNFGEIFNYIFIQLRDGASYHLWYIYLIIGIYLFIPIISRWTSSSTKNQILYFILIWIAVLVINIPIFADFKPNINLIYFSGYLGYVVVGYYLTLQFNNEKKLNKIGGILFISGVLITAIGTFILTKNNNGELDTILYNYLSLNVVMASVGVFLLFKNFEFKNLFIIQIFKLISKYSYGIYLSHIFAIMILSRVGISCNFIHPLIGIPLTTILCLLLSFMMTYCLNKLPFGKYVSG